MGMELAAENVELTDAKLFSRVRAALKSAHQGDLNHYKELLEFVQCDERHSDKVARKVTTLEALSGSVFSLDIIHHRSLVSSILGMSMWNYGTDVMDALMEFVISLATSRGKYLDLCLEMLVMHFMPPPSFIPLLNQSHGINRKDQVINRVHSTLIGIAKLIPLSPLRLMEIVKRRMPFILTEESVHAEHRQNQYLQLMVIYVENMLKLASGEIGDVVGRSMLLAIMDRLIELDVNIPWNAILHEEFTKDGDELRISWMERFSGENFIAQQLDSLMVLTFDHLNFCKESGRLSQVFDTLLQSFQQTVLPTYRSKFAQFVMFYACSLDPENCGRRFADTLFDIFKISICLEQRMSAVAYLASFLARSKFLPISFVAEYVESLVKWCSTYCSNQSGGVNPLAHKEFYAGCQAMMYVLCFHMRSMLADPRIRQRISKHIEDILRHPLSPLMVCLPSIVKEILRFANLSDNFVSSDLLKSEVSMAFGGEERFDMFFPFDPFLLMRSDRYIRPHFVYWSMVRSSHDAAADVDEGKDDIEIPTAGKGMDIANNGAARSDYQDRDEEMSEMLVTPEATPCFGGELRCDMQMMPSRIPPTPESL